MYIILLPRSAKCRDDVYMGSLRFCILSFCQAQLRAGMAEGRVRLEAQGLTCWGAEIGTMSQHIDLMGTLWIL